METIYLPDSPDPDPDWTAVGEWSVGDTVAVVWVQESQPSDEIPLGTVLPFGMFPWNEPADPELRYPLWTLMNAEAFAPLGTALSMDPVPHPDGESDA
jgi:hypothetical protein